MRALLTRLVLAVVLTVSGFAGTGAPFAAQTFQGISDPRSYAGLQAWYDVSDVSSMLNNAGANPTNGQGIKLISDKSGNSSVNVLCLNGVNGNYGSSPDSVPLSITGDIDLRADVAMDDWTPSGTQDVISKWVDTGNQRGFQLVVVATTGVLRLVWSVDGVASINKDSTVAPAVSDFGRLWIRGTLDVDNGAGGYDVRFYTSTDGVNWVQLGSTVTTAGSTSIFDNTAPLQIGTVNAGTAQNLVGKVYRSQIYAGLTSSDLVFDANFATAAKLAPSFTESSSNAATVTINTSGATGARISGARDLYQGTAANQPVYLPWSGTNYGYLNGVSGNYFSAPNAAPVQITGDIDLRAYAAADDWTPSSVQSLVTKNTDSGSQISYRLDITTTGAILLWWSTDGTVGNRIVATSTVGTGGTDFSPLWIRATLDVDNGAGGYTVTFYTGGSGTTPVWVQLGATVVGGSTTSIFNGSASVNIGSTDAGSGTRFIGRILRAQIYSGIAGTLAFDFNPSAYVSGTTFLDSSVNAATITINSGANIVNSTRLYFDGSNDYLKAAAFALAQPETVYFVGSQVTWTSGDCIWAGGVNGAGVLAQDTTTPGLSVYAGTTATAVNSGLALSTNGVVTGVVNGISSSTRVNRGTPTTGGSGSAAPNGFTLGGNGTSGGTPANITAQEVLVYSNAASTAQQDATIGYLARKWGISGGFAHMPPPNVIPFEPNIAPWRREDELIAA